MKYFDQFNSNTYAGSGNQLYFAMNENEMRTGRVFYKISAGGEYNYSVLFSNIIDSTYDDGSISHKNLICENWTIHSARIGRCVSINLPENISEAVMDDEDEQADIKVFDFKPICFNGQKTKEVMPGEFFASDPVKCMFEKDEYLCLEMTFSGKMIPYHEETLLPVFVKENEKWKYSKFMPFAGMIGCDREVKGRIAYFGDSITQGIGTKTNSYLHWNALLSEKMGSDYSYWNLGIGYGRANDAASDGAWMYKAKQNDIVFVCYGVNDIRQGQAEEQIKSDLTSIIDTLKKSGKKVILQTIPPFNYQGKDIEKWKRLNSYILTELAQKVDFVFDNTGILGKEGNPEEALYGGHPNEEGYEIWANALFEKLRCKFSLSTGEML
ncbi:MAG: SGNH/GDSL hydrolase family protein [Oscillospiraceae bacterium]|nr:SGNH/GDSL hydrolase family protein [Oscillospiraceae bacterium]